MPWPWGELGAGDGRGREPAEGEGDVGGRRTLASVFPTSWERVINGTHVLEGMKWV